MIVKRWGNLLSKITGISTPVGGVQWSPPADEKLIAKNILSFLGDRRILFSPSELEIPEHCIESVNLIRKEITEIIRDSHDDSVVDASGEAIRAACRRFIDRVGRDKNLIHYGFSNGHWASWIFLPALGELRALIGIEVAVLSDAYDLRLPKELKSILPPEVQS